MKLGNFRRQKPEEYFDAVRGAGKVLCLNPVAPWPPDSGRIQTVRWTTETDGHFSFSGPWTDAGALTAADGKIRWFSNNAAQPVDLTYQFNGEILATHGPLGDAFWWRAKLSAQQSRRSTQREKSRTYVAPDDAAKREILRRMFRHFP